jgi:hypothetical protein
MTKGGKRDMTQPNPNPPTSETPRVEPWRRVRFWVAAGLILLFAWSGAVARPPNLVGSLFWIVVILIFYWRWDAIMARIGSRAGPRTLGETLVSTETTLVRVYRASNINAANRLFAADATELGKHGYEPTNQSWSVGQPGCLRFLLIGLFAFIVRPTGTLTVTYVRRA